MNIYTIIVTYNASSYIHRCLAALEKSLQQIQVIVVDNASTDDTLEIIKSHFKSTILIESKENLGFGLANNLGIQKALQLNCDYVFLLNQDAFVNETTLEKLMNCAKRHPEFDLISPVHLNQTGTALDYAWEEFYVNNEHCPGFISDAYFSNLKEIYPVSFVNAAAWLISAKCLKVVGGFNQLFFMYGEDIDYVNRLYAKKLKIGINAFSTITHERVKKELKPNENFEDKKKRIIKKYFLIREIDLMNLNVRFVKMFCRVQLRLLITLCRVSIRFKFVEFYIYLTQGVKMFFQTGKYFRFRKESQKSNYAHIHSL